MADESFKTFTIALVKEYFQISNLEWDSITAAIPLRLEMNAVNNFLLHQSFNFALAIKVFRVLDSAVYYIEFPVNFEYLENEQCFVEFFLGPIVYRFLNPKTPLNLIRYAAYLINYAAFCWQRNQVQAPNYAVTTLTNVYSSDAIMATLDFWQEIFEEVRRIIHTNQAILQFTLYSQVFETENLFFF